MTERGHLFIGCRQITPTHPPRRSFIEGELIAVIKSRDYTEIALDTLMMRINFPLASYWVSDSVYKVVCCVEPLSQKQTMQAYQLLLLT